MKILLVDDSTESRESVSRFLERLGHDVDQCENGLQAWETLQDQDYHILISDIRMPEMDGHELLKKVKASPALKDLVVILFTGYGDIKHAVEAMRDGAYDYLLKPVDVKEVAVILEKIGEYIALKQENREFSERFQVKLDEATEEIRLELENIRKAYAREFGSFEIGIFSDKFAKVIEFAKKLHANPDIPVLIEGETGTGKEIIARIIHYGDAPVTTPFIGLNCAAISRDLFESELFGYEPGTFTGGDPKGKKGKLESAENGSIFLDEISELQIDFQAKLLRVLQEREYYRVGGLKRIRTDARFICATNKDIVTAVNEGSFRKDLFYRLKVGHFSIPPLRKRPEEILPLAEMFLAYLQRNRKTNFEEFSSQAQELLKKHSWPGNIRELKSVIERICLLWDEKTVQAEHVEYLLKDLIYDQAGIKDCFVLSPDNFELPEERFALDPYIREIVKKAYLNNNKNKADTARYLGITRSVLYTYLKYIDIDD